MLSKVCAHFRVHSSLVRLPGVEAVHIAVVHAEGSGYEDCIVNLDIGCSFMPSLLQTDSQAKAALFSRGWTAAFELVGPSMGPVIDRPPPTPPPPR